MNVLKIFHIIDISTVGSDSVNGIADTLEYIVVSSVEVSTGTQSIYTLPPPLELPATPFELINNAGTVLEIVYEFFGILFISS